MSYKVIELIFFSFLATSGLSFVIQKPDNDAIPLNMERHDVENGGNMQRLAINVANNDDEFDLWDLTNALIKGGIEETVVGALRKDGGEDNENDLKAIGAAIRQGFLKLQEKALVDKNAMAKGKAEESLERRKRSEIVEKDVDISMSDIDKAIEKMNGLNKQFASMVDLWDNYHLLKADAVPPESSSNRNNEDEDYESGEEEYESEEEDEDGGKDEDLKEGEKRGEKVDPDEYTNALTDGGSNESYENDIVEEEDSDEDDEETKKNPKDDEQSKDTMKEGKEELDSQNNKSAMDDSDDESMEMNEDVSEDKEGFDSLESQENEEDDQDSQENEEDEQSDEAKSEEEEESEEDEDYGSVEAQDEEDKDEDIDV